MQKPKRRRDPEERRAEILAAAFALFSERGFAATRIEDVAARAGIAKGTVYLHFPDKEALFISLASSIASPILGRLEAMAAAADAVPARAILHGFFRLVDQEVLQTERRHLLRLMLAEGPLFPVVTEFYHTNIIKRAMPLLRQVLEGAAKRGELRNPAIAAFPQLVFAPVLLSIVWRTLFEAYEHLDAPGLFETFLDTIFVPEGVKSS